MMTFHKFLGDSKMFEYERHYRECQQQNMPFIKSRTNPRNQNCFVQIDMMSCGYHLSEKQQKAIFDMVDREQKYLQDSSKPELSGFSINEELAWFDGISAEHVSNFCETLFDLTQRNT